MDSSMHKFRKYNCAATWKQLLLHFIHVRSIKKKKKFNKTSMLQILQQYLGGGWLLKMASLSNCATPFPTWSLGPERGWVSPLRTRPSKSTTTDTRSPDLMSVNQRNVHHKRERERVLKLHLENSNQNLFSF